MTLGYGRSADVAAQTLTVSAPALPRGQTKAAALEPAAATPGKHHFGFRDLLSDLNPLQYIPVIGTIFRAVTGDVIPEPVRDAGSVVVSTLIAGPIGAAINLGELAAEKLTGIDPEKIGDKLLADIGIGRNSSGPAADARPAEQSAIKTVPNPSAEAPSAWSKAQLAAYGVTTDASGELVRGNLTGSDVLNSLELEQLSAQRAAVQYAATAKA